MKLIIWTQSSANQITKVLKPILVGTQVPYLVKNLAGNALPKCNPGDVILAMGMQAVTILQNAGIVPKNKKVGALRNTPIKVGNYVLFVSFAPGLVEQDYARLTDIQWDCKLSIRYLMTGSTKPKLGDYRWVSDFTDIIDRVNEKHQKTGKRVPVALDLETVGLDPYKTEVFIVSISFSVDVGKSDLIRFSSADDPKQPAKRKHTFPDKAQDEAIPVNELLLDQIKWLLSSPRVSIRGANLKFDMQWMLTHWEVWNWDSYLFDTTLVGSLLDANRSNSLTNHAKIYCDQLGGYDDHMNDTYDKGRMDLIPDEDLLPYAGGDTDACLEVSLYQQQQLVKVPRLANFYIHLLQPANKAFAVMEKRGLLVDLDRYLELDKEVTQEVTEASATALKQIPFRIRNKYIDNLKPTRKAILNAYLFTNMGLNLKPLMLTEKSKQPSTTKEHLDLLAEKHPKLSPFFDAVNQYAAGEKLKSTYITGFLSHLRLDCRFHTTYLLFKGAYDGGGSADSEDAGTNSGRTSSKAPAYQTLPKHTRWAKPLRSVYKNPPGMVQLHADYSQGELRVIACIANEPTMIQTYKDGIDLHVVSGSIAAGMEPDEVFEMAGSEDPDDQKRFKYIRQNGKAANFGLIYGIGAKGFQIYAKSSYGVDLSLADAERIRAGFFDRYPIIIEYHEKYKQFARTYGYVESPLGRRRDLPLINAKDSEVRSKAERQAINAPVQGTLSDLGLLAIAELYRLYPDLWVFGFTHDCVSCYVPKEEYMLWAKRLKTVMENLPLKEKFGWEPQLNFDVDVEVGFDNMSVLDEIKGL